MLNQYSLSSKLPWFYESYLLNQYILYPSDDAKKCFYNILKKKKSFDIKLKTSEKYKFGEWGRRLTKMQIEQPTQLEREKKCDLYFLNFPFKEKIKGN